MRLLPDQCLPRKIAQPSVTHSDKARCAGGPKALEASSSPQAALAAAGVAHEGTESRLKTVHMPNVLYQHCVVVCLLET